MFKIVFLVFIILGLVFCIYMLAKNNNTYKNHIIINHAILGYKLTHKNMDDIQINYSDMENYDKTLYRLYDWGYTRILPTDKMKLIEPYIDPKYRFNNF